MSTEDGRKMKKVVRNSLLSTLIPPSDWDKFFGICRCSNYTSTHQLQLSKKIAFYIVIEGEVIATLSNIKGSYSNVVSRYLSGDIIHLFSNSLISSDGCLLNEHMTISFSAIVSTQTQCSIMVSVDWDALNDFLIMRTNLTPFKTWCNLNITNLMLQSPLSLGLRAKELEIFGPLLSLRRIPDGHPILISSRGHKARSRNGSLGLFGCMHMKQVAAHGHGHVTVAVHNIDDNDDQPVGLPMGLVLTGACVTLAPAVDFEDFKQFQEEKLNSLTHQSLWSRFRNSLGTRLNNQIYCLENIKEDSKLCNIMKVGTFFGLEQFYLQSNCPKLALNNIMAIESCIVGLLSEKALEAWKTISEPSFQTFTTNYNYSLLKAIQDSVPLFSATDINDNDRRLLANNVEINSYCAGAVVYKHGHPGDYLHVVLVGSVLEKYKESKNKTNSNSNRMMSSLRSTGSTQSGQGHGQDDDVLLRVGQYFGEIAVVAETAYAATAVVLEPTVLLSLKSQAFRTVFGSKESQNSEIRIRLLGLRVDLEHVMAHPRGCELFTTFINKEHSGENVDFWQAVDKFLNLCNILKRHCCEFEVGEGMTPAEKLALMLRSEETDSQAMTSPPPPSIPATPLLKAAAVCVEEQRSLRVQASGSGAHTPHGNKNKAAPQVATPPPSSTTAKQLMLTGLPGSNPLKASQSEILLMDSMSSKSAGMLVPMREVFKSELRSALKLATDITKTYVQNGAPLQINIPGKMQANSVKLFKAWASAVEEILTAGYDDDDIENDNDGDIGKNSAGVSQYASMYKKTGLLMIDSCVIFENPKREVIGLLRKDTFVRFKQTPEFPAFIASFRSGDKLHSIAPH